MLLASVRRAIRAVTPAALAVAAAGGIASMLYASDPTERNPFMVLYAPFVVTAGQPINGWVSGGVPPMCVSAWSSGGFLGPNPGSGPHDPLYFSIPTNEPMFGDTVTISAGDALGFTLTAFTLVQ